MSARLPARAALLLSAPLLAVPLLAAPAGSSYGDYWAPHLAGDVDLPSDFVLAADTARDELVLLGSDFGPTQTWTFDGTAWTRRTPASSPGPRSGAAFAFDAARGTGVLFGGTRNITTYDETWLWDGASWTLAAPATKPPGRWGAALAYDAARQVTWLFGGYDPAASTYLGDLWKWNGVTWTQVAVPGRTPAARAYHAMVWSAEMSAVVLLGGTDWRAFRDCWIFDGAQWNSWCSMPFAMHSRRDAAMAVDAHSGTFVVWGGRDEEGRLYTDTWLAEPVRGESTLQFRESDAPYPPMTSVPARMAYLPRQGRMVLVGASGRTWFYDGLFAD